MTQIGAVKFVAVDNGTITTDDAVASLRRFYGAYAWTGIENMVLIGGPNEVAETVHALADSGLHSPSYSPPCAQRPEARGNRHSAMADSIASGT